MIRLNSKLLLVAISILVFVIIGFATSMKLEYIAAEIIYGDTEGNIIFSKKSGFYEESFYLSIYAPTDEVYYTLDGSDPTKEDIKYDKKILIGDASNNPNTYSMNTDTSAGFLTEELGKYGGINIHYQAPNYLIDKCTVIKVAYYDQTGERSLIEEQVYFVDFEEKDGYENVNVISIATEPDNFFDSKEGIYVLGDIYQAFKESGVLQEANGEGTGDWEWWNGNYHSRGKEWERKCSIQVFDKQRNLVLSQNVGIRIQGGGSRGFSPKSLNIYARDEYGANKMNYDFFGTGYLPKRVTLTSGGDDYYAKMKDRLVADLAEDYEFAKMHYEPYVLFLNGEYWGYYFLTEKYDAQYIENYYGVSKDNVIMVEADQIEIGHSKDLELYESMTAFITRNDMSDEDNYRQACEMLDIQSFIDYFAVEIYIGRRGDWPDGNFALWRSRSVSEQPYEDGKWRWMLYDVNSAGLSNSSIEHDTIAYVKDQSDLFESLCKNQEFYEMFSKRLVEISETIFEKEHVNQKLDEYVSQMKEPLENHHLRFFGVTNEEMVSEDVDAIRNFANQRKEYIEKYIKINLNN